jgi:hypothetical protein
MRTRAARIPVARKRSLAIAIAVVVLLGGAGLVAAPREARADDFGDANRAFQAGRAAEAAAIYEGIVARGVVHEDLFYDLGNAYFRAGKLGPAIWSYERALRVEPSLDDARFNLAVAQGEVAARVADRLEGAEIEPLWVRVVTTFSLSDLGLAVLALDALVFGLLVALRFLSVGLLRTAVAVTAGFAAVAALGAVVLFVGHIWLVERIEQGIVLPDRVVMREGPDHTLAERGELHPGLRVRVLAARGGWLHVRLANGVDGWLPADVIGRL